MEKLTPTLPPPPQPPAKPTGFFFVYVATLFGIILAAVFSFFIMGTIWPFMIGFAILAIIALQYLIWGWWFERIYRSGSVESTSDPHDDGAGK